MQVEKVLNELLLKTRYFFNKLNIKEKRQTTMIINVRENESNVIKIELNYNCAQLVVLNYLCAERETCDK